MRNRLQISSATIRDVAKAAAVSVATVSRVYNSPDRVREATRNKVFKAAEDLQYSPRLAARALALQRTNIIGMILPDLGGEFFSELICSTDEVAWQHGYHIMISASHSHRDEVDLLLRLMSQGWVDGLILMVPVLGKILSTALTNVNIPIVLLNLPEINHNEYIQINVDNYRGAYLITRHLLSHKYWPIAIIRGPVENFDAEMREQGYRKAITEEGLSLESDGYSYLERGDFTRRSGYLAMNRLLSLPQQPRAVFAANDEMAIGAMNAIRSHGLRIPQNIAIAGFDDIDVASCIQPALTTVHLPITKLGNKAAEYLIAAIEKRESNRPRKLVINTGLEIRESCGCMNRNPLQ